MKRKLSPPAPLHRTPIGLVALLAIGAFSFDAQGQGTSGGGSPPIEVLADNAIEWDRERNRYSAEGNAVAIQGDNRIYGDRLIAFYRDSRESGSGGSDIYRMEAVGNVRVVLPDQTITGSRAVREVDKGLIWMVGNPPVLTTRTDEVTASDRLEYWERTHKAVARGNATARAIESDRTVSADVLEADFSDEGAPQKRGSGIRLVTATGNVRIVTENEIVTGDTGTYSPGSGLAVLLGRVYLEGNDGRRLSGSKAEVNMKTGISRLFSDPSAPGDSGRVRAIFDTGTVPGTGGKP